MQSLLKMQYIKVFIIVNTATDPVTDFDALSKNMYSILSCDYCISRNEFFYVSGSEN